MPPSAGLPEDVGLPKGIGTSGERKGAKGRTAVLPIGSTVPCQNRAVKGRHRISRRHYAGRNRSGAPSPHGKSPN